LLQARVELHAQAKIVTVPTSLITKRGGSTDAGMSVGAGYGAPTPLIGAQTPAYGDSARTPMHQAMTPSHDAWMSSTPLSHNPAMTPHADAGDAETPAWRPTPHSATNYEPTTPADPVFARCSGLLTLAFSIDAIADHAEPANAESTHAESSHPEPTSSHAGHALWQHVHAEPSRHAV
jgi:hypothetical protein